MLTLAVTAAMHPDVQRGVVHRRFADLREGMLVVATRSSIDRFYMAWSGAKHVITELTNIPDTVWFKVYNRMRRADEASLAVPLVKHIRAKLDSGELVPFNAVKKGTLKRYISHGVYPGSVAIIVDEAGKERTACVIGAPEVNATGHLAMMTDRSILFYPN